MNPLLQLLMQLLGGNTAKPAATQPQRPASGPQGGQQGPMGSMPPVMQILLALAAHAAKQEPASTSKKPQSNGTPMTQGRQGSGPNAMRRNSNAGGYAGPGASEMTSPGMAHLAALLGGGPVGGAGPYGSSSLGNLPNAK